VARKQRRAASVDNQQHGGALVRPLMPNFPPRIDAPIQPMLTLFEHQDQFRQDWFDAGSGFQQDMALRDYIDLRMRHSNTKGNRDQHNDLHRKVGKLTLPYFDGFGKMAARAWVQKLDTYFTLNPMLELEFIQYASIHFHGIAHEWWYNGMLTLEHVQITSYRVFTKRLIERFDKKDSEMHLKELAQLKQ
jgi:hypothetical protein